VDFLQNHDQIGNRALGGRIPALARPEALRLAVVCTLLSPHIPMLFMGEEFAASTPFLYFCDFGPPLSKAVTEGRRREFAGFARFRDEQAREAIPDPNSEDTFLASKLHWDEVTAAVHRDWHRLYSDLLELRRTRVVPHLQGGRHAARFSADLALCVDWTLPDGARLALRANFSDSACTPPPGRGEEIYASAGATAALLPAWGGIWLLETGIG
jgi:1,4-alpha-glucan branching enzyme